MNARWEEEEEERKNVPAKHFLSEQRKMYGVGLCAVYTMALDEIAWFILICFVSWMFADLTVNRKTQ